MNKLLLISVLLIKLPTYAMQQTKPLCDYHSSNELLGHIEIIPHRDCNHQDKCGYCCNYAEHRSVTQCWHCDYRTYSHEHLGTPKEFFRKQSEQEKQLVSASRNGDVPVVLQLLRAGVNPNTHDFYSSNGDTPLMFAAAKGHPMIVDLLLKAKAHPNVRSLRGETALFKATAAENKDQLTIAPYIAIVQSLLAEKANPELHPYDCNTPLRMALMLKEEGHKMVHALLDAHANPLHQDPLNRADEQMAELLKQHMQFGEKSSL